MRMLTHRYLVGGQSLRGTVEIHRPIAVPGVASHNLGVVNGSQTRHSRWGVEAHQEADIAGVDDEGQRVDVDRVR